MRTQSVEPTVRAVFVKQPANRLEPLRIPPNNQLLRAMPAPRGGSPGGPTWWPSSASRTGHTTGHTSWSIICGFAVKVRLCAKDWYLKTVKLLQDTSHTEAPQLISPSDLDLSIKALIGFTWSFRSAMVRALFGHSRLDRVYQTARLVVPPPGSNFQLWSTESTLSIAQLKNLTAFEGSTIPSCLPLHQIVKKKCMQRRKDLYQQSMSTSTTCIGMFICSSRSPLQTLPCCGFKCFEI